MEKYVLDYGSIKNVGVGAVDAIVKQRQENGEFKNFTDFCERIQSDTVNKKCIESLIKAGAFDSFNETRSTLMASFEGILDTIQGTARKSYQGQVTMFDLGNSEQKEELEQMKYTYTTLKEYSEKELLSMEKEMLGLYISGHPLEPLKEQIAKIANINTLDIKNAAEELSVYGKSEIKDGKEVKYVGIISSIKKKYTKNNTIMAFVTIEDIYGAANIIVFDNCYQKANSILVEDNIVLVTGKISIREDDDISIVATNITTFDNNIKKIHILDINITNLDEQKRAKLKGAIKFFTGERNNYILQITNNETKTKCGGIYITEEILEEFIELVGYENIKQIEE